jgi:carbonic anhydrase
MAEKKYDYVGYAGGVKDLITIVKQLDISVRLHHISQVILMNHEDCGAYGKESTHERHSQDLKTAKIVIHSLYPDLLVDTYYLHLDGQFEKIK